MSTIRYRPHIDGLRGIAVAAVVLYHAKLLGITGGFVGVDVFFVVSGFLIASIIDRDMRERTFSLFDFWKRRIRRIVPALVMVMCSTVVASYFFILYPSDFHHFGNAVIAQSLFASNILFTLTDNYFDQPSRYSPLLHTWSLSVEEQFYLLFPFLILACAWLAKRYSAADIEASWRGRYAVRASIVILGVASLILNVWMIDIAPSSAFGIPFVPQHIFWSTTYASAGFYLILTRAWELALGICIALSATRTLSKSAAEAISIAGIASILFSVLFYTDSTSFPGIAALLPTLGTAAFIFANEHRQTRTAALLSYPALVWIGLISYSLYLWHWPILVFAHIAHPAPLSAAALTCLIAAAVCIAWLSYRFIETPFRREALIRTRKMVFACGLGALALMLFAGVAIVRFSDRAAYRIPQAAQQMLLASEERDPSTYCFHVPQDAPDGPCRIGDRSTTTPAFVVWGDSHAGALVSLFDALGRDHHLQGVVFQGGSCVPITGVHQAPPATGCEEIKRSALQYISAAHIRHIFLVARWSYYVTGGPDKVRVALITDSSKISKSPEDAREVFERRLTIMARQMAQEGRTVYILEQTPEQTQFNTRDAFYTAVRTNEPVQARGISAADNAAYQALARSVIEKLAAQPGIRVIDPIPALCTSTACPLATPEGVVLYRDGNHVSTLGALKLRSLFEPFFKAVTSSDH